MAASRLHDTTTNPPAGGAVVAAAAVAHLARYRGLSREHTESDLRIFFRWCDDRDLDVLRVQRVDLELYLR